jgi:hypothetical protein
MFWVFRNALVLALAVGMLAGCKTTGGTSTPAQWYDAEEAEFPFSFEVAKLTPELRQPFVGVVPTRQQRFQDSYFSYLMRLNAPGRVLVYYDAKLGPGFGWSEPDSLTSWVREKPEGGPARELTSSGSIGAPYGRIEYVIYTRGAQQCTRMRSIGGDSGGDNWLAGTEMMLAQYCGPNGRPLSEDDVRGIAHAMAQKNA